MHCVNLSVQDTISSVPMMRDFLHFINDLITFLKGLPKRSAIVEKICKDMHCKQTHIRPLCPTRFTVKYNSLSGLSQQINAVIAALEQIEKKTNERKAAYKASGLSKQFTEFELYFCLHLGLTLFEITDRVSAALQSEKISCGEGINIVQYGVNELKMMRNEDTFQDLWHKSISNADSMGADSPKLPKARRAPTKLEESKPHQYQSPDELYRARYYEILDTTAESLNTRINDKANVFLVSAERLLVAAWAGTDIYDIDIEEVSKNGDIDAKRLIIQLKSLENLSKYKTAMITNKHPDTQAQIEMVGPCSTNATGLYPKSRSEMDANRKT